MIHPGLVEETDSQVVIALVSESKELGLDFLSHCKLPDQLSGMGGYLTPQGVGEKVKQ